MQIDKFLIIWKSHYVHPKVFENVYIRKDILQDELERMIVIMHQLDYASMSEYDKGGFDGYNQAVTEILKKLNTKFIKLNQNV